MSNSTAVRLSCNWPDAGVQVVISKPVNTTLQPMGYRVDQRNGQVEEAFADIPGGQAVYRTSVRNRYKTKGELA